MIASRNMYTLQSHMCSVPNLISSVSTPVTSLAMRIASNIKNGAERLKTRL